MHDRFSKLPEVGHLDIPGKDTENQRVYVCVNGRQKH